MNVERTPAAANERASELSDSICTPSVILRGAAAPVAGAYHTLLVPRSPAVKYSPLPSGAQVTSPGSRSSVPDSLRMLAPSSPITYRSAARYDMRLESAPVKAMVRPSGDTTGSVQVPGRCVIWRIAPDATSTA